ncbi:PadR family transcriptional regulator [Streptomyces sp. NPDC001941]|uniref:PadR family transcriptional regulator n=1 Tax=Streptomyces sp. NPDC001941 TaxID=3154659 RepID=UPI003331E650
MYLPPQPPPPPPPPPYPLPGHTHVYDGWGAAPPPPPRPGHRPDLRAAVLLLLREQPHSGHRIAQELERRSLGMWRPRPGSVYPVLQQCEEQGLVRATGAKGSRLFHLTEEGARHCDEDAEEWGTPWDTWRDTADEGVPELYQQLSQLSAAVRQVGTVASGAQVERAGRLLARTRRELYLLLAEDDDEPEGDAPAR